MSHKIVLVILSWLFLSVLSVRAGTIDRLIVEVQGMV